MRGVGGCLDHGRQPPHLVSAAHGSPVLAEDADWRRYRADDQRVERPGRVGDYFPPPFANDQAARAANGGALPPDMSVLAKARGVERGFPWFILDMFTQYQEGGPDYIHAIVNGYDNPPQGFKLPPAAQYNKYFPGHAIGMPSPPARRSW